MIKKEFFTDPANIHTTRTMGKISIHFNPGFSTLAYVEIAGKENLRQYYPAIQHGNINLFIDHKIPWQHYEWLLAWRPVVEMFDERMREITSQNKTLLIDMIPNKPPAEPFNPATRAKLNNYKKQATLT